MLSDRVSSITPSQTLAITARAKEMIRKGRDVLVFAAGEPDFPTPEHVKEAAKTAIDSGFTYYTPASGIPELKSAIVEKLRRENGLEYGEENVIVTCGAKHALYNLFQTILNPGDEVIVFAPYWVSYLEQVKQAGGIPVVVETDPKFNIPLEEFSRAISDKTKAVILNSPCNPTGKVIPRETLAELAGICVEKNILIVSDEVYEHFSYSEEVVSPAQLSGEAKKITAVVNAVSKTYSMTGWRIGYVAGPSEIIKGMSALQSHQTSNPCSISQKAALAALEGPQDSVLEMKAAFKKRRDIIVSGLRSIPGIRCEEPEGAFYVFPDISGILSEEVPDSLALCERLLEEAGIALVPGSAFGREGHVRMSYSTSESRISEGVRRFSEWVKKRNQ